MSDSGHTWSQDQREALDAEGDLVLAASAGTGKTTILVQKFCYKLLELADEADRQDPDALGNATLGRMVAITFTELAAAELKNRIRTFLSLEAAKQKEWLLPLMRRLDNSFISTIHSFCSRILRDSFLEAGLSPTFAIIPEEEAGSLKEDAATQALKRLLDNGSTNRHLADLAVHIGFCALRKEIISVADRLRSDGYTRLESTRLLTDFRAIWKKRTIETMPVIREILKGMDDFISRVNSGSVDGLSPTETTLSIQEQLQRCVEGLQPFFQDPEKTLNKESIKPLESLHFKKFTSKKYMEFNQMLEKLRELWQWKNGEFKGVLSGLAGIDSDIPRLSGILEAIQVYFETYEEMKRHRDALDFEDLLLLARDLLKEEKIRKRYSQQFHYLYIDEFQDVNPVQREIVTLLYSRGDKRSLVIVGDGKQSIYRFRAADVLSFDKFAKEIEAEGGKRQDLVTNFRCHPALVRTFNSLFENLFSREKDNMFQMKPGKMEAFRDGDESESRVEWIQMSEPDSLREGALIALLIERLAGGESAVRFGQPFGYGDIAVLLPTMSKLPEYEEALRNRSIPYIVVSGSGFYRQREIWDLVSSFCR